MKRGWWAVRACCALVLVLAVPVAAVAEERLPARVRLLSPEPVYVGQEVAIELTTIAGGQRAVVRLPSVPETSLAVVGQALRPISSNAIGDVVNETIQYSWRLRLVPGRAGTVVIPPVSLESGGRSGTTSPLRVEVRTAPASGRPASFLGGVGPIEARLEVVPSAVRVQEPAEVRLVLEGPGARGSTQPMLEFQARLSRLAVAPEVEELADESRDDPARRVRRFRVRPTRDGEVSLPPVIVSWFDPIRSRYQSTLAGSVSLRVVELPRLDLGTVVAPTRVESGTRTFSPWWFRGLGIAGLLVASGLLGWVRCRRWDAGPRQEAKRQARQLREMAENQMDGERMAGEIEAALAFYLQRATGRALGALTPEEAAEGVRLATGRALLATEASGLLERCDRARFAVEGVAREVTATALQEDAVKLLERIAKARHRGPSRR